MHISGRLVMNSLVPILAGVTALLGACASVPNTDDTGLGPGVDARTVRAVNRVARANGIEVHWINYPLSRPAATPAAPAPTGTSGS